MAAPQPRASPPAAAAAVAGAADAACTYRCALCASPLVDATTACAGCRLVHYCSAAHAAIHAAAGPHGPTDCARLTAQAAAAPALRGLPFDYVGRLHEYGALDAACDWLSEQGLHGAPLWRTVCGCGGGGSSDDDEGPHSASDAAPPSDGNDPETSEAATALAALLRLPPSALPRIGALSLPPGAPPLAGWAEYQAATGLPRGSPAAALLAFPLTVYAGLAAAGLLGRPALVVHYLGARAPTRTRPRLSARARARAKPLFSFVKVSRRRRLAPP